MSLVTSPSFATCCRYKPFGRERGIALRHPVPSDSMAVYSHPFFPVYKVRWTKNPDKFLLSPEPLRRLLKRQPDPVEDFYKTYKDDSLAVQVAVNGGYSFLCLATCEEAASVSSALCTLSLLWKPSSIIGA